MDRKNAWTTYSKEELDRLEQVNTEYKNCLDAGKTERECVTLAVEKAKAEGYKDIRDIIKNGEKVKAGDKLYAVCMNKTIALFHMGTKPLTEGMNILGAHIDSPRIDVKQNPLYENEEFAYLDTHYYGGIKKYQWVTLPLALHGVIAKKDGTTVQVSIGEKEDDPVFVITDLLIHLASKQMEKKAATVVEGEKLDLLIGSRPIEQDETLEEKEKELQGKITKIMMTIPNIIDPSVPIGKDDSCNVEIEKFGEPVVPDFEIPYHTEIMERFDGIDLDAAGKVAGNGFYYLMGDIARLHSAVISYARDFMIDRGFTYCVPPFMIRSNVVTGVMSFDEMDAMMYKIEGEDLYLIGTSEHSMIGKFIDTINEKEKLPYTLTSYSPCFRKEKGAHGIEERGVYRIHQFEKQEMIVVCEPEESKLWYDKLWQNTVDLFRSLDIPVRTLECCSGDLADLKVKSCDVEAWSPRQKKYFEVGSCSNLGDAQARRLKIRIKNGKEKYFAHTLNNTVVAPPRMLIAFLENNLNEDGSVNVPEALRPYMGGKEKLVPKH